MDSEMPRMSGPAATEALRQKGYTGIIIGVTGNVMEEQQIFFKSKGANKVLGKPLDIAKLEDTFKELENVSITAAAAVAASAATNCNNNDNMNASNSSSIPQ